MDSSYISFFFKVSCVISKRVIKNEIQNKIGINMNSITQISMYFLLKEMGMSMKLITLVLLFL
jgi:hypothetical protein